MNAVESRRRRCIDRHKAGMCQRGAKKGDRKARSGLYVVGVTSLSGDKPRILDPENGLSDAEFHLVTPARDTKTARSRTVSLSPW